MQGVQRVIASEATHRAGIAPGSGYVSDTKAEENGWDSNVLSLGAAWMNSNSNAPLWLTAAKKYLANSYTVANTNGDPLSPVDQQHRHHAYPDFAIENHGFYHPTYQMVAGMSMGDSLLMARLSNPTIATQLQAFAEHNILNIWSNENHLVMDSGEFAYPSGLDWKLHDYRNRIPTSPTLRRISTIPLARWADQQLSQMVLFTASWSTETVPLSAPAGADFIARLLRRGAPPSHGFIGLTRTIPQARQIFPAPAFELLADVCVVAQRKPVGLQSDSATDLCTNGSPARVMAVIEPPFIAGSSNAFVTTPRLPGVIGLGALGNPTGARLIALTTNADGFQAELQITNGANGITEVYLNSAGDAVGIVEVPWPSVAPQGGAAGSFSIGIENDPLVGGSRLVEWPGGSATITNRTGVSRAISNNWVCVSGRYGVTAGPAGYFSYQAASSYNRLGAAEEPLPLLQNQLSATTRMTGFRGRTRATPCPMPVS